MVREKQGTEGRFAADRGRAARVQTGGGAVIAGAAFVLATIWLSAGDPVFERKLALMVWAVVAIGVAVGWLPRGRPAIDAVPLTGGLVLLLLLTAISLTVTSSVERTFDEIGRVSGYLGLLTLGLCVLRAGEIERFLRGLLIGAVGVCVLALVSRLFPELFTDQTVNSGDRLEYPFGYWNALAAWCAVTSTMLLAYVADGSRRGARGWAIGALPAVLTCLYLTYSRGGLLVSILGAVAVGVLCVHRQRLLILGGLALLGAASVCALTSIFDEIAAGTGAYGGLVIALSLIAAGGVCARAAQLIRMRGRRRKLQGVGLNTRRSLALLAIGLCAIVATPAAYALLSDGEPVAASVPTESASRLLAVEGNRAEYWEGTFEAFGDEPILGIGAGTFEFWWTQHGENAEFVRDAHSFYLEQAAELGFLGLIGAALCGAGLLWAASAPRRSGDVGPAATACLGGAIVIAAYLAVDWLWESIGVMLFALALAVAGVLGSGRRRGSATRARGPGHSRAAFGVPLVLIAIGGVLVQVPGLVSADRTERSADASARGLQEEAYQLATEAMEAAPWAASPYVQRAVVSLVAGDQDQAIRDLEEGWEREPENFRFPLAIARLQVEQGRGLEASRAFSDAERLAPLSISISGPPGDALKSQIEALTES